MTLVPAVSGGSPAATSSAPRTLGQEDFLLLLTTQLKAQDPLSPMDNSAFVAQLAQFATVSGVTDMKAGIDRLASLVGDGSRHAVPAWIGRTVTGADGIAGRVAQVLIGNEGVVSLSLEDGRTLPAAAVATIA
jgi:flagellar basal-body rod modification protein FlgD